ncbi:MATE family efflux transporter [SCandidatus Aminicenantes bacterium Aminicenantia_JdfR_composite]|jgi:putative MATE family efflux protein|nr:MATE family efflux transporter [SCandidatus Aminicenantes bacterium Aminicenantia_JdfR_composite]MCP2620759.1 MATE family efflux transporter [Candidatus Aminicenantes bacterium AC-334-E05]
MEEDAGRMDENLTRGVKTLLGDPKKAVLKLSGPMIVAMFVQALYNIVDGIWVAGLGSNALAAIGLFFPLFMIILSLAIGIGIGGSSAISRKIGAKNKKMADSSAIHTLVIGFIIGILLSSLIFPFLRKIFTSIGAKGEVLQLVVNYGQILVGGAIILVFTNIASGILRGEGDTKRAMYAMILGSGLNMFLDPIFIYKFRLGVVGAAWATLTSIFITSLLMIYWLFIKKDTYVDIKFKSFKFNTGIIKEILRVGIPSSFAQLSMSLTMIILNIIIVKAGGTDGIAIFTSAWRIIMIGIVPLLGIAIGVTAVTASAYGARDINKLKKGYLYSIKFGFIIEIGIVILVVILAPQLSYLFTYSKDAVHIHGDLIKAFRSLVWFLPAVPFGMLTSSMFQGIGHGEKALAVTFLRTIIMQVFFSYLFGILLNYKLIGIWWGIVLGNVTAATLSFVWGKLTIKSLKKIF